jgi:hypothetical protein
LPPGAQKFDDRGPLGIGRLDHVNPLDGIRAAQCEKGVAHPRGPVFETSQGTSPPQLSLTTPAPNGEHGG